jgi:hypothetical protein
MSSRSIFVLAGRLGGYSRAARHDGELMTRKARQTFALSFLSGHGCKVCPRVDLPASLTDAERARRGEALRRAHYTRVALESARARAGRRRKAA